MSADSIEIIAVRPGAKPLYARPTGNLAAAMIGVVAVTVLGVAAVFVKPQPTIEASADNGGRNDSGDIARAPGPAPIAKQNAAFDLDGAGIRQGDKGLIDPPARRRGRARRQFNARGIHVRRTLSAPRYPRDARRQAGQSRLFPGYDATRDSGRARRRQDQPTFAARLAFWLLRNGRYPPVAKGQRRKRADRARLSRAAADRGPSVRWRSPAWRAARPRNR